MFNYLNFVHFFFESLYDSRLMKPNVSLCGAIFLVTLPNNLFSSIKQTSVKESELLGYMFRYKNICVFSLGIISHKNPRGVFFFFSVFILSRFFPVSYNT